MTLSDARRQLLAELQTCYTDGEAAAIAERVLEHVTGWRITEQRARPNTPVTAEATTLLQEYKRRLLQNEPVQYVLGEAWFCGYRFLVSPAVLIPRPETEELVEWVISNCRFPLEGLQILDVGTGSGCIAVSLKRRLRKPEVWACDRSEPALQIARRNAEQLGAPVHFLQLDFLNEANWAQLPVFDIIVSNPPYISREEHDSLEPHVADHEPAMALFAPDTDALIFYRKLSTFAFRHLRPGGHLFVELHSDRGASVLDLFRKDGYEAALKQDLFGQDRMVRATRPR